MDLAQTIACMPPEKLMTASEAEAFEQVLVREWEAMRAKYPEQVSRFPPGMMRLNRPK